MSALSSGELRKYEHLTGEDLGYKPSVLEQKRFHYSPLSKIFNKWQTEKDNKKGLLKRLRNIKDKNEEQLELFSKADKTSRLAKNESDYNYDNNKFGFYKFYRVLENFRKSSLGSKYNNISEFYGLLNELKTNQVLATDKTRERKTRVINTVVKLYGYYFDFYKKK